MKSKTAIKKPGRPRAFDVDQALDQAMRIFWKSGYEGASLPELTAAMGINRPSLYAAFGNKEELFRKTVARYVAQAQGWMREAMDLPTAKQVVETILNAAVAKPRRGKMRGCLLVNGALACSESAASIQQELSLQRHAVELTLKQRFERARSENDLPNDVNPAALAKYVVTFQNGLAVQIAGGANRDDLVAAIGLLLQLWPKNR